MQDQLLPTDQQIMGYPPTAAIQIPETLDPGMKNFLTQASQTELMRSGPLRELEQEYESDVCDIREKFRPDGIEDALWTATKPLMIHMNTTKIAIRSLEGVYSGSQTRRVTGTGKYVEEIHEFANSQSWRETSPAHFIQAVLYGTSAASPVLDPHLDELTTCLHDPVRMRLYAQDGNVRQLIAMVDKDRQGRYMHFATRVAIGTVFAGQVAEVGKDILYFNPPLPYMLTSIAYGEDQRAKGLLYGNGLVGVTPGYNRILTNCYYYLGLLIKWQGKSLLFITSGQKGGVDALPKKVTQIAGQTALLYDQGASAQFLSPMAKFSEILDVINSYLSFLAVSIGIPKSIFQAQDNVSAQSARLEGAPMISKLRKLARQFEEYEKDFLLRSAALLHLQRDQSVIPWKELRKLYRPVVRLDPWDYTDDAYANAAAMVQLVQNGLMRVIDAARKVNPEMTDTELAQLVEDRQAQMALDLAAKMPAEPAQPAVAA